MWPIWSKTSAGGATTKRSPAEAAPITTRPAPRHVGRNFRAFSADRPRPPLVMCISRPPSGSWIFVQFAKQCVSATTYPRCGSRLRVLRSWPRPRRRHQSALQRAGLRAKTTPLNVGDPGGAPDREGLFRARGNTECRGVRNGAISDDRLASSRVGPRTERLCYCCLGSAKHLRLWLTRTAVLRDPRKLPRGRRRRPLTPTQQVAHRP